MPRKKSERFHKNIVHVDYAKFMKALETRATSVYAVSEEMGYTSKVLQVKAHKGYLAPSDVTFLEKVMGIPYAEYAYVEPEPVVEEPEEVAQPVSEVANNDALHIDPNELFKVIYVAVYSAVKDAWEGKPPREVL